MMQTRFFDAGDLENEVSADVELITSDELITKLQQAENDLERAYLLSDTAKIDQGAQVISDAYDDLKRAYDALQHIYPQLKGMIAEFDEQCEKALELNGALLNMMITFVPVPVPEMPVLDVPPEQKPLIRFSK